MWKDKLVLIPGLITLIVLLAGTALSVTALYGWHLAIHPDCARVNYTSGARRILAIVLWAVAAAQALVFLGNLCPETMPQRAD